MAHLVEQMAYVGQTPWHGLGNALTPRQPLEVWTKQAGMDWQIMEAPVCYLPDERENSGRTRCAEGHKVLYRSDTHAALSVVGQRYKTVQPRQILEFYRDLTEGAGFELETAGVLKGGRKCWALARTGQAGAVKGNDLTRAYVLLATACDGTMATTAQFTSVRVVCNNTLAIATAGAITAVKVRHNTIFDAEAVKRQLGISITAWDEFMYRMKMISDRKVSNAEARHFLERVFLDRENQPTTTFSERTMGKVLALFEGKGKGANLPSSKGTAYGLLNAVTEFVDHKRRARNPDYRLDSAWFGKGATIKNRALREATLMAA